MMTERNSVVLGRAAEIIQERGWGQGGGTGVCLLFALSDTVEVDVDVQPGSGYWDAGMLAEATDAYSALWLSSTPHRRFRLWFDSTDELTFVMPI